MREYAHTQPTTTHSPHEHAAHVSLKLHRRRRRKTRSKKFNPKALFYFKFCPSEFSYTSTNSPSHMCARHTCDKEMLYWPTHTAISQTGSHQSQAGRANPHRMSYTHAEKALMRARVCVCILLLAENAVRVLYDAKYSAAGEQTLHSIQYIM